jgi:hypothetical protein
LCNRTRNGHFAYLKQATKSNFAAVALNDDRKSKCHLIFDTNQSLHVRQPFRFFGYQIRTAEFIILFNSEGVHETETSLSLQFSSDIFTIIYKMNCLIYIISIETCKPNLCVFIDSEVNFTCSFYNM